VIIQGRENMLDIAVQWLISEGGIEQVLGLTESEDTPLTTSSARAMLEHYISKLENKINSVIERLDQQHLGKLHSGLSQLRDSTRTSIGRPMLAHALNNFHEITSLPTSGRTGGFNNGQLRSLAFFGMASIHKLLGDGSDVINEKIVMAVDADPETAERFLDKNICMAILRRISPNQYFQLNGSLNNRELLFPTNYMYLASPGLINELGDIFSAHLWVRTETQPITGSPRFVVGLTRYSAQLLIGELIHDRIHLPHLKDNVRQNKKCGKLGLLNGYVPIYAPLSGKIIDVNYMAFSKSDRMAKDPYGEGWLFTIISKYSRFSSPNKMVHLKKEIENLYDANTYYNFISKGSMTGTVSVNWIAYTTKGGRNKNQHLDIMINLVDHLGNPVPDSTVEIEVRHDGGTVFNPIGTTGVDGIVTFTIMDAQIGRYWTHVMDVKAGDPRIIKKENELLSGSIRTSSENLGVKGRKVLLFSRFASPDNIFYKEE
jgi:glycine cleavage system H protein